MQFDRGTCSREHPLCIVVRRCWRQPTRPMMPSDFQSRRKSTREDGQEHERFERQREKDVLSSLSWKHREKRNRQVDVFVNEGTRKITQTPDLALEQVQVNLLLQLAIGGGSIEGSHSSFQLRSEIPQICDNAARVCEALVEFAVSMRWFPAAVRAVKVLLLPHVFFPQSAGHVIFPA